MQGVNILNNIHRGYQTITPSDTDAIDPNYSEGFLVSVAGTVRFDCKDASADVTLTFAIGDVWYADLRRVYATGTTATVIGIKLTNRHQ
jgi:hypothetical protein